MLLLIGAKFRKLWKGQFSSSDLVLDVGCGSHPRYHRHIPSRIICSDITKSPNAHLISDAQAIPFRPSSFDGVVSVNSLYYCEDPKKAVSEFSHVLKKGGRLVMVTPFIYPIHDAPHDRFRFTEYGLRELLKDGFVVQKVAPIGGLFSVPLLMCYSLYKGSFSLAPIPLRLPMKILSAVVFFIPLVILNVLSLLDFFDRSGRWPIYYFTIAKKK
ncbi:MAG TPA: class I SAM-dependent methyltransferase [Candidatus Nanoarchaeia archaeon]|nr:class I SAM-dependent methyltransferase [Candidatus Nanoarchaeia archaeon]